MKSTFELELPKTDYCLGDPVRGKLHLDIPSDRKVHGIHIQFYGREWCEYSIWHDIPFKKKWIVDGLTTVFGTKIGRKDPTTKNMNEKYSEEDCKLIKAGKYVWPFTFKVPKNIPPSCDYRKGKLKIEYMLLAYITVPWGRSMTCKKMLTLGSPVIVDPERPPSIYRKQKTYHLHSEPNPSGYRKNASIELEAYVEQPMTYSGGKLSVHVKIHNSSGKDINFIKVKLKRHIIYGSSSEKETVMKHTHIDKQFPLGQCTYHGLIPLIVPNIDLKPSVHNASLCKVNYYVSVRAKAHIATNLRARVPITICTFQHIKEESIKEEPQVEKKEEKEGEPINLIDFEWDTPVHNNNNLTPPLEPKRTSLEPVPPKPSQSKALTVYKAESDDDIVRDFRFEDEFQQLHKACGQLVSELDSLAAVASAGQLADVVKVGKVDAEHAQKVLEASASQCNSVLPHISGSVKARDQESYIQGLRAQFHHLKELVDNSKVSAVTQSEATTQQSILQTTKSVALATQQSMIASKELLMFDPFHSNYSRDYASQMFDLAAQSVDENAQDLVKTSGKATAAVAEKVEALFRNKVMVDQSLAKFGNFSNSIHEAPTDIKDMTRMAQILADSTAQFVSGAWSGNPSEEAQNKMVVELEQLFRATHGTAPLYPHSVSGPLLESVKKASAAVSHLLAITATMHKSGKSAELETAVQQAMNEIYQNSTNIAAITQRAVPIPVSVPQVMAAPVQQQVQVQAKPPASNQDIADEEKAERELSQLSAVIMKTARSMMASTAPTSNTMQLPSAVPRDLQDPIQNVASAISQLLNATHQSQQERVMMARNNDLYYYLSRDPNATVHCLEKAREITVLLSHLTDMIAKNEWNDENVKSVAKAISAATAHLISAYRAKADPNSATYNSVLSSAKVVTSSLTTLLNQLEARSVPQQQIYEQPTENGPMRFRDELESYAKIAKLEKQLEEARSELTTMRKVQYQ